MTKSIAIITTHGVRWVDAHVFGNWAAHRKLLAVEDEWSVTYVLDGKSLRLVTGNLTKDEAVLVADYINRRLGCGVPDDRFVMEALAGEALHIEEDNG